MKLLQKNEYNRIEELLRAYKLNNDMGETYQLAMKEIIEFFDKDIYKEFLNIFYFDRYKYINRYADNRSLFNYLCSELYVQEPTLYMIRKEIVYKSAMIFYKYNIFGKEA